MAAAHGGEIAELLIPQIHQDQQVLIFGDADVEQGDHLFDTGVVRGGGVVFAARPGLADPQRVPVGCGDDLEVDPVSKLLPLISQFSRVFTAESTARSRPTGFWGGPDKRVPVRARRRGSSSTRGAFRGVMGP